MTRSSAYSALLLLTALGCGGGAVTSATGDTTGTGDTTPRAAEVASSVPGARLDPEVRPTRYALTLAIDPARTGFTGVAEIDVELPGRQTVIYLHGQNLEVVEASITPSGGDPRSAEWSVVDEERQLASLTTHRPVGPGVVRIRIAYSAPFDLTLEGLYRTEHDGEAYAFTQMEPLGARKAFPCFDEPSFKTPYDVTLVVQEDHAAIANARELHSEPTTGGMRRVRFATTEPLPTYLIAFAVGPLDVVEADPIPANGVRSSALPFRGVAVRGQGPRLAHALRHTPAILAALEDYFGIPYPYDKLDIIAVPDFAAGAMENAGAVTFRDVLLLVGEDAPVRQQRGFAYVMAHELAHMWFGNLVTMEWWDDLWLNEAFATWMETQTIERTFPEFEPQVAEMGVALSAMNADSLESARQIRQPIESLHDIRNAFDSITYSKGNAVLAMFQHWLTPEAFRDGVRAYLREHAEGNATAEDLMRALSAAAERDVTGPFHSFLEQPGVPLVEVTPACTDGVATLSLRQSRYRPLGSEADAARTWQLPFCARYRSSGETRETCTLLTETEGQLALEGGCPDWVMPNAGGVGYYRWTLPAEPLEQLRERGLTALDVREAMSFADSIEAGFEAGQISYADAMNALMPLSNREERTLAAAPMGLTQLAIRRILTNEEERASAQRWARLLYRAQLRRVGWTPGRNEDPETKLWRATLLSFLALVVDDVGVRREATRRGRAYLGLGRDGAIHSDAVAPDLAPLSLTVAIQEGGAEVFDHALERFYESTDPVVRGNLIRAISATRDGALGERALGLALDERVRVNEIFRPLMAQLEEPATRDAAWTWLVEHYDPIVARMGPGFAGYLPYAGSNFCTAERATEVRTFFASRVGATQGGPRNLESAVEHVSLCAARVEYARDGARAFFSN